MRRAVRWLCAGLVTVALGVAVTQPPNDYNRAPQALLSFEAAGDGLAQTERLVLRWPSVFGVTRIQIPFVKRAGQHPSQHLNPDDAPASTIAHVSDS